MTNNGIEAIEYPYGKKKEKKKVDAHFTLCTKIRDGKLCCRRKYREKMYSRHWGMPKFPKLYT